MTSNSFSLKSSLEHISSLAKRANTYVKLEVMPTGLVQASYKIGKKQKTELLADTSSVVLVHSEKVEDILSTLATLTGEERHLLLRELESYPEPDPQLQHPIQFVDPRGNVQISHPGF